MAFFTWKARGRVVWLCLVSAGSFSHSDFRGVQEKCRILRLFKARSFYVQILICVMIQTCPFLWLLRKPKTKTGGNEEGCHRQEQFATHQISSSNEIRFPVFLRDIWRGDPTQAKNSWRARVYLPWGDMLLLQLSAGLWSRNLLSCGMGVPM